MKKTVLFLCTHNSARSQMAEGLVNHYFSDKYSAFSAGTEKTKVNPFAIQAMNDSGIDISSHYSKTLDEFLDNTFDYVVTVCDNAKENCPYFSTNDGHTVDLICICKTFIKKFTLDHVPNVKCGNET